MGDGEFDDLFSFEVSPNSSIRPYLTQTNSDTSQVGQGILVQLLVQYVTTSYVAIDLSRSIDIHENFLMLFLKNAH
jgi:hypothetical protein